MQEMNEKIRAAFQKATPDVLDSVLSDCREQKGTVIHMTNKKNNWLKRVGAIAAALALVIGLGYGISLYRDDNAVASTVSLDVNPSVQLTVNRKERVLQASALNTDGQKILEGMELEGSHIDVAVNAVLGSMLRNGYLSDMANSILVSVNSKDAAAGTALQQELTQQIQESLSGSNFTGAVLAQTVTQEDELERLAREYGISQGKAQLIRQLIQADPQHTFQELAGLSINELKLLSESSKIKLENVSNTGTASQENYIGREAALAAALAAANTTREQVTDLEVDMDYEGGKMIYEVEFDLQGKDYEYDIDAVSGQILWADTDPTGDSNTGNAGNAESYISADDAKAAALAHAGVAAADARELACELDRDEGKVHYDVEFSCGGWDYDYQIDAETGKVLKSEKERDD